MGGLISRITYGIVLIVIACQAQTTGYKDIPWGSTSATLKEKFPSVVDTSIGLDTIVTSFVEHPISTTIDMRLFNFYKDRLMKVKVVYKKGDNMQLTSVVKGVIDGFVKKYGKAKKYSSRKASMFTENDLTQQLSSWENSLTHIDLGLDWYTPTDREDQATFISATVSYFSMKIFKQYENDKSVPVEY